MVEEALLGLLLHQPMHGYELFQAFERAGLQHVCAVKDVAQLYPFLRRMRQNGWVTERVEHQESRPDRKVYHVTAAGKQEFANWLTRPVVRRREIRDELLTKLRFASTLDPERALRLLDEQIAIYQAYQAELEQKRAAVPDSELLARFALESGIRHSQTDIDWAIWCKAEIARQARERTQP